ncbi:TlpA disulfide reductase family protein [Kineosporia babensis]|uniref:TlpA family protein disulfide reductase n=1 Tax=Kineosporia babensis TaxID=499548 RepID=A0A9X1NCB1_9ACTN|nr:TlpA disulfide reductase family protein [Kineosporia babensis]MCD5311085.1 TlpA family protein disulfide reductase [Kineosporia babensis]
MKLQLSVQKWANAPEPDLRNQVVLLYAFQMLCPNCVNEATPMMNRVHEVTRRKDGIQVVGLHTVFENHANMGPDALAGYIARAGVSFPVGIDRHDGGDDAPVTMRRLNLMGTPSIVTVDRGGTIREKQFGTPTEEWLLRRADGLAAEVA